MSDNKPKLIYIKQAEEREPKLLSLIKDIQDSGVACYQKFENVEELAELLVNDLAVVLTERFHSLENGREVREVRPKNNLPTSESQLDFMPLVHSYALYQRGFLHSYLKEYEQAKQRFQESINLN